MSKGEMEKYRNILDLMKMNLKKVEKDIVNIKNLIYTFEEDLFDVEDLAMMNIKLKGW